MKLQALMGFHSNHQMKMISILTTTISKGKHGQRTWNTAVMDCYFLSRPVDEEGKPVRGYRRRIHNIWKERHGTEITEQRFCEQARMIRKN